MYEISVVEIARPRTTKKYLATLPPLISWAATRTTVERMPESTLTRTGVPNRGLNLPR